ncbi:hypothetical protein XV74_12775 [Vibrio cholerae]|nr:hypothetical protein XV74_12775 [Vibrio cholerae]NOI04610.1 hypothetical protein [Vibrio anguillarum]KQA48296.1 hypothetical protein XV75_00645 [Vibrio cholerae]KQA56105.1 hypothetical protein XV79_14390 [Vibrio cholerae]KQA77437.1 hypothetical protein XV84_00645 [Vibrio cholerae]
MIDAMIKLGFVLFLPTFFPWLAMCVYLTVKLKRRKYQMIKAISETAPTKFRDRSRLLMESNASWVFASSTGFIWFACLMLRYGWRISKEEIQEWRQSIKSIYDSDYPVYRLSTLLANVWLTGLPVLLLIAFRG